MMVREQDKKKLLKGLAEKLLAPLFIGAKTEILFLDGRYIVQVTTLTKTPPESFEVIASLQHLLRLMAEKLFQEWCWVEIDIDHFRQRQEEALRRLALQAEERVLRTGRAAYLKPMTAWERRVIHLTLQNSPNVITESLGQEPYRKVVVKRR